MLWIVVVVGVLLDQLTKYLVVNHLPYQASISVIGDFFSLRYIHNEGAAWSILDGRVGLLSVLTIVITLIVIYIWYRTPKEKKWMRFAFALLVAGALGNIIDRLRLGYVIDFMQLPHWPIFNLADCMLVVSVILLCVLILFDSKAEDRAGTELQGMNDEPTSEREAADLTEKEQSCE